jgi:hypothetical protein
VTLLVPCVGASLRQSDAQRARSFLLGGSVGAVVAVVELLHRPLEFKLNSIQRQQASLHHLTLPYPVCHLLLLPASPSSPCRGHPTLGTRFVLIRFNRFLDFAAGSLKLRSLVVQGSSRRFFAPFPPQREVGPCELVMISNSL